MNHPVVFLMPLDNRAHPQSITNGYLNLLAEIENLLTPVSVPSLWGGGESDRFFSWAVVASSEVGGEPAGQGAEFP